MTLIIIEQKQDRKMTNDTMQTRKTLSIFVI